MTTLDTPTNMKTTKEEKIIEKVKSTKKKRKSYKSLMKSFIKSNLTEEERIEKQRAKLDNILVDANFKKVDII
jgi:hypothetical protein